MYPKKKGISLSKQKLQKNLIGRPRIHFGRVKKKKQPVKTKHERAVAKVISFGRWKKNNPVKYRAHKIVFTAIRNGSLKRKPCRVCGNEKAEAHHDDYTRPLYIKWLCKMHHSARHKTLKERGNTL